MCLQRGLPLICTYVVKGGPCITIIQGFLLHGLLQSISHTCLNLYKQLRHVQKVVGCRVWVSGEEEGVCVGVWSVECVFPSSHLL